jgi:hypothetical protein
MKNILVSPPYKVKKHLYLVSMPHVYQFVKKYFIREIWFYKNHNIQDKLLHFS